MCEGRHSGSDMPTRVHMYHDDEQSGRQQSDTVTHVAGLLCHLSDEVLILGDDLFERGRCKCEADE